MTPQVEEKIEEKGTKKRGRRKGDEEKGTKKRGRRKGDAFILRLTGVNHAKRTKGTKEL
jgi:hypothetical protein